MEPIKSWEVVKKRKWIIIQAVAVVGLIALIGSWLIAPTYQSVSKIMIKKAKKGAVDIGAMGLPGLTSMIIRTSADVSVNRVLATSRPYINEMISNLQIRNHEGDLLKAGDLTQGKGVVSIGAMLSPRPAIRIAQFEATEILEIRASSGNPHEAMMMANTLARMMVDQNQKQTRAEYRSAREFLEGQLDQVKERYLQALSNITDFRKKEKTIDLKLETKHATERMTELLKEKENDIIILAQSRGRVKTLNEQLARQNADFLYADTVKDSPQIAMLVKTLTELQFQLTQSSSELTDNHPRIIALKEQIRLAEDELDKELKVYQSSAPALIGLERQISATEAHLERINKEIGDYLTTLGGIPDKVFRQESMGMELNVTQQVYRALLDSMYEIGIGEASTLSEIRIVEQGILPSVPMSPKKRVNTILGAFMGMVLGLGVAFLLEYLDDTVKTVEDMKEFRPIALVGNIPRVESNAGPMISSKDPNDPLYESYRSIRNFLRAYERTVNTLLITSPGPREGKSTTVVNLGISVAREGRKVVLVDMDLRRPSLHTFFGLSNDTGVTDVLQKNRWLDDALVATSVDGLSIVPSGPPSPDPGRLIESERMGQFLSELGTGRDLVIVDAAPVLVKGDALILAKSMDGTLIVVETEKTTRRAVHETLDILARSRVARPLGFVLNGSALPKGKFAFHQYYYGRLGNEMSVAGSG